jgi:lauroyl/myristoyl acyltransferase
VQHVQQLIREQPENWLWSHARWKQKRQPNE